MSAQNSNPAASNRKMQVVLYDLHQVTRFIHAVAYAQVAAANTHIVRQSFLAGGDVAESAETKKIRNDADRLAASLMTRFSHLCKTGSKAAVENFLDHQRRAYISSRKQIDAIYAQVRQSNANLQRNLGIAADITHIVHGTANATFTILSFFATAGVGLVVAKGLNTADSLLSGPSVIGVVKDNARDEVLDQVGEKYSEKAGKTLANIVTRDWKYQGALENAQVRFAAQGGVAVGAKTLAFYFAVKSLKENAAEIQEAFERLQRSQPANQGYVNSVPNLQLPTLR